MLLTTTTPFSQRAGPSPLWSKASPKRRIAPVMGGPGESSPRSGFEGAGAPRQPQCITLGRLAPRHLAVRRRRRTSPPRTARRRAVRGGVQVEGRLAETELRPRPRGLRSSGSLSGPTIPVSPQAAGPAVPEREIGAGGVPGCSGMPGAWKLQPAPGKARGFRGQDTVERHDGLSVVMEKIDQWEQENPASKGREIIDDFRLRGSRTWRRMGGPLTRGGWRTEVAH